MKILWFVNIPLPAVRKRLGLAASGSGWWLTGLADELTKENSVNLTVAHCSSKYCRFERFSSGKIDYWMVPAGQCSIVGWRSGKLVRKLAEFVNQSDADVVDIHGSEYVYGQITPFVKKPVAITIQGLISEVRKNLYGKKNLLQSLLLQTGSLRDIKPGVLLVYNHLTVLLRAKSERKIFKCNRYFLGRTDWDKTMAFALSKNLTGYYNCHRILRPAFYHTGWSEAEHNNHSIFCCGRIATYKGLDDLVYLISLLKNKFTDVSLRIAGGLEKHGWGGYIRRLANKLGVAERIYYLGYLNAEQIAKELKKASVYVHPSYIDNSPNTLAEAMCVGTPCVASSTGGIASMIQDSFNGLLFETGNLEQLAEKVSRILADKQLAEKLGDNARQTALERHNPAKVARETLAAYQAILENWNSR